MLRPESKQKAEEQYNLSEEALAEYADRNLVISTQKSQIVLESLRNKRNLDFQIYSGLAQQKEELRITINRATPVFNIIQNPVIPFEKSTPNRALVLLIMSFLGVALTLFWFTTKYVLANSR